MTEPIRVLTIGHSYVVAQNQAVPAAVARDRRVALTLAAPTYHHGDLRPVRLERWAHPDYTIIPLLAYWTRWNHLSWYDPVALRRLVTNGRFDVIHAWEEPYTLPGYQIAAAAARTSARFAFRTAQSIVKSYPWPFSSMERATLRRAHGWVAGGKLVYDAMVAKGFPADKGRIITLGVDMEQFRPLTEPEKQAVLSELGLRQPVIGFLGRLVTAKGLGLVTAALDRVGAPWSLLVLGSGPYEATLLRWATARSNLSRVRIRLVPHNDVPRYLGAIDLLVAPSQTTPGWKEQFGRMVIEAFACRVPVIGSDSGEIPHVIGDAGLVLPEADVDAWARAIEHLLVDHDGRADYAARGYERCSRRYDVRAVAQSYVTFYHDLVT